MAFTYTPTVPDDITRVRFALSDTDSDAPKFSDEEINFQITELGSWPNAVIGCIDNLIARLVTDPDFDADWLQIDSEEAIQGLYALKAQKLNEYGLVGGSPVVISRPSYRDDSPPSSASDW